MPTQPYKTKDGSRVPGTTTVIGACKLGGIEGLLAWANREGLAGRNHRDSRDKAADAGTCAHDMVECHIRGREFTPVPYDAECLAKARHAFQAFHAWAQQTKLSPAHPELSLLSETYRYGGTLDAMFVDGNLAVGDWKTSNGVYVDHLLQLAAYGNLWTENFPDQPITGGYHLVRFSKPEHPDDPVHFVHHHWANLDAGWEAFKHCRALYELQKRLKALT